VEGGISFAAGGINGHDFGMQIVGKRNDRKDEGNEAENGNGFLPSRVAATFPRHRPAKPPERKDSQRDSEPGEIEDRFHQFAEICRWAVAGVPASGRPYLCAVSAIVYNGCSISGNLSRFRHDSGFS